MMNQSQDIGFSQLSLPYKIKLFSILHALGTAERMISKNLGDQYVKRISVDAILAGKAVSVDLLNKEIAKLDEKIKVQVNEDRKAMYLEESDRRRRRRRSQ